MTAINVHQQFLILSLCTPCPLTLSSKHAIDVSCSTTWPPTIASLAYSRLHHNPSQRGKKERHFHLPPPHDQTGASAHTDLSLWVGSPFTASSLPRKNRDNCISERHKANFSILACFSSTPLLRKIISKVQIQFLPELKSNNLRKESPGLSSHHSLKSHRKRTKL